MFAHILSGDYAGYDLVREADFVGPGVQTYDPTTGIAVYLELLGIPAPAFGFPYGFDVSPD